MLQLGVQSHWPAAEHVSNPAHMPQLPPQPSGPHCLPAQLGMQSPSQAPSAQVPPPAQRPSAHLPPQPSSSPHCFASQEGSQASQVPSWQTLPPEHDPQVPPQPSGPHSLPAQAGTHGAQLPLRQACPVAQPAPQVPPHPSGPHSLVAQLGVQVPHTPPRQESGLVQALPHAPQLSESLPRLTHCPSQQDCPTSQLQQKPFWQVPPPAQASLQRPPQPSLSPHNFPVQSGEHCSAGASFEASCGESIAASEPPPALPAAPSLVVAPPPDESPPPQLLAATAAPRVSASTAAINLERDRTGPWETRVTATSSSFAKNHLGQRSRSTVHVGTSANAEG